MELAISTSLSVTNNLLAVWVPSLGREDPLQNWMATHSSILAWRILGREEPGRLQSTGSQRVRHHSATFTFKCHCPLLVFPKLVFTLLPLKLLVFLRNGGLFFANVHFFCLSYNTWTLISLFLSIQKCFYYLLTLFSQAPEKDSLNTWQVRGHDKPRVLL